MSMAIFGSVCAVRFQPVNVERLRQQPIARKGHRLARVRRSDAAAAMFNWPTLGWWRGEGGMDLLSRESSICP
jgi:hypothetical protein